MSPTSWEKTLTDAYWDYRWRKIMDPLCDTFQKWKAGELGHSDVNDAIDRAYKEKCLVNNLLTYRPDRAAAIIQWWDREWFLEWIKENRPPADVDLGPMHSEAE
ncbi:MAG: hypothetical protein P8189_06765 [Anaerolineae bacterium]|jgi:hypothetical protein